MTSICHNCGDHFDAPERECPDPSPGIPYVDCGRGGHYFIDHPLGHSANSMIRDLESELAHMTKLHELSERAMHSAHDALRQFEALYQQHLDEVEPLEQIGDMIRSVMSHHPLPWRIGAGDPHPYDGSSLAEVIDASGKLVAAVQLHSSAEALVAVAERIATEDAS